MNKKILRHMAMLVALLFAAMAFTACSNDDPDGDGDGNGSDTPTYNTVNTLKMGDETWDLEFAYYNKVGGGVMQILFCDFDAAHYPYPAMGHILYLLIPGGYDNIPTGTWPHTVNENSGYGCDILLGNFNKSETLEGLISSVESGDLNIKKDGDKYEITLPSIGFEGELGGSWKSYKTSFRFKGKITQLPGTDDED